MGKISQEKKIKDYYKIYEQIYEDPTISLIELSKKTKMSRNTISKYLHEMYEKKVLVGPYLEMKSCSNYTEYVYLMNFSDPFFTFKGLRDFPHVVYHAMTSGSWNTLVVTDRNLDFSKLVATTSNMAISFLIHLHLPDVA